MPVFKKGPLAVIFTSLLFGSVSFFNVASRPRFESIHTLDVLQLIVTGVFIGVALVSLGTMLAIRAVKRPQ